jgi:hypothetical protein
MDALNVIFGIRDVDGIMAFFKGAKFVGAFERVAAHPN